MAEPETSRARLVGINHVAISVADVESAIEFYESIFTFDLRGRSDSMAFLDMGDQFLAIATTDEQGRDEHRHVGIVVDDPERVERRLEETEAERLDTSGLDFRDPWGNRLQVVGYEEIQFTKAPHVLRGMGLDSLEKSEAAIEELAEKGLAPD